MASNGTTYGVTTFTAYGDLQPHRLVQTREGSLTVPAEVLYADGLVILGITQAPAKSGDLVPIKPLNADGVYEIAVTVDTAIITGTALYISDSGDGTLTDDDTSGIYAGQALQSATTNYDVITVGGVVGAVGGSSEAALVGVVDASGFYSSDNVEGALQEVGEWFTRYDERRVAPYEIRMLDGTGGPLPMSPSIGGIPASDSSGLYLQNYGGGLPVLNVEDVPMSHYYFTVFHDFAYNMDFSRDLSWGIYYASSNSDDTHFTLSVEGTIMAQYPDLPVTFTDSVNLGPTAGGSIAKLEIASLSGISVIPYYAQLVFDLHYISDDGSIRPKFFSFYHGFYGGTT